MKGRIVTWVLFILSIAIGGYPIYLGYTEYGHDVFIVLAFTLTVLLSFPLFSLFHELGHLLFGAMVKIKANPEIKNLTFFGYSSCTIIPKTDRSLKGRIIFTTLGGLYINLVFIALGVVALFVPAVPVAISICVLPASFYLFALNAIPLHLDDGKTDGLVIYELIRNDDTAKVMLAVLTVQAQVLNGKPIEEVDEKLLFDLPQIQEDDQSFIALTELRYEYFKARGEEEQAEKYRERFEQLKQEYM